MDSLSNSSSSRNEALLVATDILNIDTSLWDQNHVRERTKKAVYPLILHHPKKAAPLMMSEIHHYYS